MHSSTHQPSTIPVGEDGLLLLQELETELRRIEQDVAARFGNEQELQRRYHENLKRLQSLETTMQHLKKMGGPVNGTDTKESSTPYSPVLSTFVPPLRPLNPPPPPPMNMAPAQVHNLPDLLPPSASTTPPLIPPPPPPRPPPSEPSTQTATPSPPSQNSNPPPLPPRAPTTTLQTVPSINVPPPPPPAPPAAKPDPPRPMRQDFGVVSQKCKVEVVYSLLNMLGTHDKEDISRTLLAMSSSPETCLAMRHSGCLARIIQLLHGNENGEASLVGRGRASRKARRRAAQALHNMVHTHPDPVRRRHEAKVLRLLEQLRAHCDQKDPQLRREFDDANEDKIDHHPGPAVAALMKLSFEEDYREAICTLGGLQSIAELLRVDFSIRGLTDDQYSGTMRRYACMALTNLTFGDEKNKVLLCSMVSSMEALVHQLQSDNEELRQVAASVLRNLSWRATDSCKDCLRKVCAPKYLMLTALQAQKETTLKSILSALWNLSAHSTENKMDICKVDKALQFLVEKLSYRSPSRSFAIVENTSGILRNISSAIATIDSYRQILREANAFPILLQHLRSPSLTIVSNACGTLWNLSSNSTGDQQTLWELGAVAMLKNLIHSKHKMISMGSAAALKNLLTARPHLDREIPSAPSSPAYSTHSLPSHSIGLHMRKQRALEAFVDKVLSESGVELSTMGSTATSATSPRRSTSNDSMKSFNSDLSHDRAATLPPKMSLSAHYTSSGHPELSAQHCASLLRLSEEGGAAVEPLAPDDMSQEWRAITRSIQRLSKPSNDVFNGRSFSGEQLLLTLPVSRSSTSENIEDEEKRETATTPAQPAAQNQRGSNIPQPTSARRRSLSGSRGPSSSLPRPSGIPRISRSASFEEKPQQSRLPLPVNPTRSRSNSRERSRIPMAVEAPSTKRAMSAGSNKRIQPPVSPATTTTSPKPKSVSGIRPPSAPSKMPTPRGNRKPSTVTTTKPSPKTSSTKTTSGQSNSVKPKAKVKSKTPPKDGSYWLKSKGKGDNVSETKSSSGNTNSSGPKGISQLTVENLTVFNNTVCLSPAAANQRRGSAGKRSIVSDEGGATYTLSEVSHDEGEHSCTETIEIDNSSEADDLAGSLEIDASVCRDDATENDSCSELESDDESNMIGGLPRIKEAEEDLDGQGLDEIEVEGFDDEDEDIDTSLALRIGAQTVLAQLASLQAEDDAFFERALEPPAMFQSEPTIDIPSPKRSTSIADSTDEGTETVSDQDSLSSGMKRRGPKIVKPDLSSSQRPAEQAVKKEAPGIRGGRRSISGVHIPVSSSRVVKPPSAAVRMAKSASQRTQIASKGSPNAPVFTKSLSSSQVSPKGVSSSQVSPRSTSSSQVSPKSAASSQVSPKSVSSSQVSPRSVVSAQISPKGVSSSPVSPKSVSSSQVSPKSVSSSQVSLKSASSTSSAPTIYQKPGETKKVTAGVPRPTSLKSKTASNTRPGTRSSPVVPKPSMPATCLTSPTKPSPKVATKPKTPLKSPTGEKIAKPRPPPLVMPKSKDSKSCDPSLDIWICRDEVCPLTVKVKTPSPASTLKCPSKNSDNS